MNVKKKLEIVWHDATISSNNRNKLLDQTPFILWFTGLSASGKSTLANIVEKKLFQNLAKYQQLPLESK